MKNLTQFNMELNKTFMIFVLLCFISISHLSAQTAGVDRAKWDNDIKYRNKIAKSANLRTLIIGKTKKEIIDLLGEPERKQEETFIYCLDKKTVLIADCKDKKENCYICNSSALTIVFLTDSVALDIIAP